MEVTYQNVQNKPMQKDNITDLVENLPSETSDGNQGDGTQQVANSEGETITLGNEE